MAAPGCYRAGRADLAARSRRHKGDWSKGRAPRGSHPLSGRPTARLRPRRASARAGPAPPLPARRPSAAVRGRSRERVAVPDGPNDRGSARGSAPNGRAEPRRPGAAIRFLPARPGAPAAGTAARRRHFLMTSPVPRSPPPLTKGSGAGPRRGSAHSSRAAGLRGRARHGRVPRGGSVARRAAARGPRRSSGREPRAGSCPHKSGRPRARRARGGCRSTRPGRGAAPWGGGICARPCALAPGGGARPRGAARSAWAWGAAFGVPGLPAPSGRPARPSPVPPTPPPLTPVGPIREARLPNGDGGATRGPERPHRGGLTSVGPRAVLLLGERGDTRSALRSGTDPVMRSANDYSQINRVFCCCLPCMYALCEQTELFRPLWLVPTCARAAENARYDNSLLLNSIEFLLLANFHLYLHHLLNCSDLQP